MLELNIAELRRLEAEATPGKWEVSGDNILINEDDEIGELILWSDKDIALIVAMRNALPELLRKAEAFDRLVAQGGEAHGGVDVG